MKGEIFEKVLSAVSHVTEIPAQKILSPDRTNEVVDARSILVYILFEEGLYPSQIAYLLQYTASNIRYLISSFPSRVSSRKMLARNLQIIRKNIANY